MQDQNALTAAQETIREQGDALAAANATADAANAAAAAAAAAANAANAAAGNDRRRPTNAGEPASVPRPRKQPNIPLNIQKAMGVDIDTYSDIRVSWSISQRTRMELMITYWISLAHLHIVRHSYPHSFCRA